jgi:purine-nucleoside phosphorylase
MTYEDILLSVSYIKEKINITPTIGLVLGSGLSPLADKIKNPIIIPYKKIPHFPISTVQGHKGNLVIGTIDDKNVICMQGRFHYYEGYTMQEVTFPIRVMKLLGVKTLIVTNAAGGVNSSFKEGDIMLINDHINRMPNPLIGKNDERFGVRFPSMNEAYSIRLRNLAKKAANDNNITLREGVYIATTGPSFETNAEYRYFRLIGADAVGMSTVPEVIVAVHSGIEVLGLSVISNVFKDNPQEVQTHNEVLLNVENANKDMVVLLSDIIKEI